MKLQKKTMSNFKLENCLILKKVKKCLTLQNF